MEKVLNIFYSHKAQSSQIIKQQTRSNQLVVKLSIDKNVVLTQCAIFK